MIDVDRQCLVIIFDVVMSDYSVSLVFGIFVVIAATIG